MDAVLICDHFRAASCWLFLQTAGADKPTKRVINELHAFTSAATRLKSFRMASAAGGSLHGCAAQPTWSIYWRNDRHFTWELVSRPACRIKTSQAAIPGWDGVQHSKTVSSPRSGGRKTRTSYQGQPNEETLSLAHRWQPFIIRK